MDAQAVQTVQASRSVSSQKTSTLSLRWSDTHLLQAEDSRRLRPPWALRAYTPPATARAVDRWWSRASLPRATRPPAASAGQGASTSARCPEHRTPRGEHLGGEHPTGEVSQPAGWGGERKGPKVEERSRKGRGLDSDLLEQASLRTNPPKPSGTRPSSTSSFRPTKAKAAADWVLPP